MPYWIDQLRAVLSDYYPQNGPADVVGYLRGSADPNVWRLMLAQQQRHQMLILGSLPPSAEEWSAAGVNQRSEVQTIRLNHLSGFIVLYGGAVLRPWGQIAVLSNEALQHYQATIESFRRNLPRRRGG
ncbi:MAG: hypothetical protein WAM71_17355 [Candidatus Korobacteraceae bacterium]